MAIQQQLNQLLYSANIGAGFLSQTPEFQEKRFKRQQVEPTKKIAEEAAKDFEASKAEIDKLIEDLDIALKNPKGKDLDIAKAGIDRLKDIDYRFGVYREKLTEGMRKFPKELSTYHEQYQKYYDIHGNIKQRMGALKEREKQLKKTLKGKTETTKALETARMSEESTDAFKSPILNKETK